MTEKQLYGIDVEVTPHRKVPSDIPPVDIVATMGCNVKCPYLPCKHREDWGLNDPTGKRDGEIAPKSGLFFARKSNECKPVCPRKRLCKKQKHGRKK